jgi:hypothetical protein
MLDNEKMPRVTKQNPCPVCGKPDWCLVAEDGSAAICQRVQEGSVKRCGNAGYLHILVERPKSKQHRSQRRFTVEQNNEPDRDFTALQQQYSRQITDEQLNNLSQRLGVSTQSLKRLHIGWHGEAYTFPMSDSQGQIIGIRRRFPNGRKVSLTGSKTGLFIPTDLAGNEPLIICEGVTDSAAALDLGFTAIGRPNCNSCVDMTARFAKGRKVVIIGDNDKPGKVGVEKLAEKLLLHCSSVKVIYPPDGIKDLRCWFNAGLTEKSLKRIINDMEVLLMDITLGYKPTGSNIKTKVNLTVKQDEKVLMVDEINLAKDKQRDELIRKLTKKYPGLDNDEVRDKLTKQLQDIAAKLLQESQDLPEDEDNQPLVKSKVLLHETDPELIRFAEQLLQSPDLIEKTIKHVHILGVAGEDDLIITIYVIGTSRLLAKPLAGLTMGLSSVGKSFVINTVSRLFPEESILRAHRITPKALQYLPPDSLVHRFVVAGERSQLKDEAAAEATRALREMISDGRLSVLVTTPQKAGPSQAVHIEQKGPIAYVESTTLGIQDIFNEDRTRFILLCADEGTDQSRAIIDKIAKSVSSPGNPDTPDSVIALHHTTQRLLQPLDVVIPFAMELRDCLPVERVEVRRTFGHLISLIQAVALLYQFQRGKNEHGQILATPDDYAIVRKYLIRPLATSLGHVLTPGAQALLDVVKSMGEFAPSEVEGSVPYGIGTVRSRIRELVSAGQVIQTQEAKGRSPAKYKVVENPPVLHGLILPELKAENKEDFLIDTPEIIMDKA